MISEIEPYSKKIQLSGFVIDIFKQKLTTKQKLQYFIKNPECLQQWFLYNGLPESSFIGMTFK